MHVFATVGTTRFDRFLEAVTAPNSCSALKARGYDSLTLQIGNGDFTPPSDTIEGVRIEWYRFKESVREDMASADLVISHAGAGSCLEALHAGKKLLAVVNQQLMDNHQIELAEKLASQHYLYYTNCADLQNTLKTMDLSTLQLYKSDAAVFADYIDSFIGCK